METYPQQQLHFTKNNLNMFNGNDYNDLDDSASDCESGVTDSSSSSSLSSTSLSRIFDDSLAVELPEDDRTFEVIRRRFLSSMTEKTDVVSIHRRNLSSDVSAQARLQSFQLHSKALTSKHGDGSSGSHTMKFGWYGCSKDRIQQVLSRGFSFNELTDDDFHGAISLSSDHSPSQSVEKTVPDENGVRHLLLCRVILGRSELIPPNSTQTRPSSNEFDSGVDDFDTPKKYIIWSNNMNSHILPEYVVSFTSTVSPPSIKGFTKMINGMKVPKSSPWISFPALISVLGKFLPHDAITLINKHHKEYKERKISRPELIKIVRQIAGDKLLIAVIKSCKGAKELKMPFGFLRNRNANN